MAIRALTASFPVNSVSSNDIQLAGLTQSFAVQDAQISAQRSGTNVSGPVTWYADGQVIAGETSATYTPTQDVYGCLIHCADASGTSDFAKVMSSGDKVEWLLTGTGNSFRTGSVVEGDMIVIILYRNAVDAIVQADCSLGTLRQSNTNLDTHVNGLWTYVATEASSGILVTLSNDFSYHVMNIGAYTYSAGGASSAAASGGASYPSVTTTADNSLVVRYVSRRSSTTQSHTVAPDANATLPRYEIGEYGSSNNVSALTTQLQATAGETDARSVSGSGYSRHSLITSVFAPASRGASLLPANRYAADSNGKLKARTSTVSSFAVGDTGISVTLSSAHKVGHFVTGNDGLGNIFIVGESVTISGYTPAYATDGRRRNGAMKNMPFSRTGLEHGQGFDDPPSTQSPVYNESVRAAVPISMAPGDVVIISQGNDVASGNTAIKNYAFIHCVAAVPDADTISPPIFWPANDIANRPVFRLRDMDFSIFPSLANEDRMPTAENMRRPFSRNLLVPVSAQARYSFVTTEFGQPTYSRDLQMQERDGVMMLSTNSAWSTKRPVALGYLQRGLEVWGIVNDAKYQFPDKTDIFEKDGGHNGAEGPPMYVFGKAAGKAEITGWKNAWHELDCLRFGDQDFVDYAGALIGTNTERWQQGMINGQGLNYPMPEYCSDISADPIGQQYNCHWNHGPSYYRTTGNAETWQAEALLLQLVCPTEWLAANPAHDGSYFAYTARHWNIVQKSVDPWILAGGAAPRYTMVGGTSPAQNSTSWWARFFDAKYPGNAYTYPWAA